MKSALWYAVCAIVSMQYCMYCMHTLHSTVQRDQRYDMTILPLYTLHGGGTML